MVTEDFIAHYGIKGQKWGERRFQNPDGTWTSEGKARYGKNGDKLTREDKKEIRKEYKADNTKAFELGRKATISARAADIARKKEEMAQKRYDKKQTEKRKAKLQTAKKLRKDWNKTAELNEKLAKDHYNELTNKYGKEHVSNIKYDKKGRVNEKVNRGKDYASAFGKTIGTSALAAVLGSPVTAIWVPLGKNESARNAYAFSKRAQSARSGLNMSLNVAPVIRKTDRQRQIERDARRYRQEHAHDYRR